jgi:hypothetical protein
MMDLWEELTELYFEGCDVSSMCHDSVGKTYAVISLEIGFLQAQIDRLMLEYCPDEMTESQMRNWTLHQKPVMEKL